MTRVSDHLLVQHVEPDSVVILDESNGKEVVIPMRDVGRVITALWSLRARTRTVSQP